MLSSRYELLIAALLVTGLALDGFIAWQGRDLIGKGYPDFTIFYSAGKMVRAGQASSLYDESAEFQTQIQFATGVSLRHGALPYNHPPFEALLFVPFSFLAYLPAYLTWNALNLGLLCMALRMLSPHVALLQTRPLWVWFLCAAAFFPIFACLLQGQDMLLFFLLLVAAYVSLKRGSDLLAGCWLGMGMFRPHLVLPLAIILLFSRRRKAVLGVVGSTLAMAAISIAVVGWRGLLTYPSQVWSLEQVMGRGSIFRGDMPNLRGFVVAFFRDSQPLALTLTAVASVFLLILAIRLFRSADGQGNLELGFSAAVLVAILVSYHAFIYDLGLLFVPAIFLVDRARLTPGDEMRRLRWQSVVSVAALFFTPLLLFLLLQLKHLNFLAPVLLLWLWGLTQEISHHHGHGLSPGVSSTAAMS